MNDKLITVWTSHVKGMAFYLEDIGRMVMDEDIIVVLTVGSGMGYDHFVTLIDVMLMQQLTVDYVVTSMLNEEAQSGEKGSTYGNEALMVNVAKMKLQAGTNRKVGVRKCWRCRETDHIHSECNVLSNVKCGNCGGRGHTMEACLKPGGAEGSSDRKSVV